MPRDRYRGKETKETYIMENGTELPLPKYYHDKLYTEEERENLWIIKQERGYRYIAGEKVSTDNLEQDQAFSKMLEEMTGQGEYAKLLGNVIKMIVGKL